MGFQHMSKAKRRRIQSLGGKASHRRKPRNGVMQKARLTATSLGELFEELRREERERIKAAILKVIG